MAAILRVKRRRTEEHADSLVISSKRAKEEKNNDENSPTDSESISNVFKFAGTVEKKDGLVGQQVRDAIRKAKLQRELLRQHQPQIVSKAREQSAKASADARFKVVSQKRALDLDSLDKEDTALSDSGESTKQYCLLDLIPGNNAGEDIEKSKTSDPETVTCNGVSMVRESVEEERDCVYDLYYINDPQFDFRALENILAIEARRDEEYIDDREDSDDEQVYDVEDDENDENNWRNDYPDEEDLDESDDEGNDEGADYKDPFDSDDDEYYAQMLEDKLGLDDQVEDLSSEEDDSFVYFKDPREMEQSLSAYDKYKARVTKELQGDHLKKKKVPTATLR